MTEAMGMKVTLRFSEIAGRFKLETQVYRNVTETHWNYRFSSPVLYDSHIPFFPSAPRVAFESDIHSTGATWRCDWVGEIEVVPETEIAEAF